MSGDCCEAKGVQHQGIYSLSEEIIKNVEECLNTSARTLEVIKGSPFKKEGDCDKPQPCILTNMRGVNAGLNELKERLWAINDLVS